MSRNSEQQQRIRRPGRDAYDDNSLVAPHFSSTPDLTPVDIVYTKHGRPEQAEAWTELSYRIKDEIKSLYRKHRITECRRHGLFIAGSEAETRIKNRDRMMVMVIEFEKDEIEKWQEIHRDAKEILESYELNGRRGVCVRYYKKPSVPPHRRGVARPLAIGSRWEAMVESVARPAQRMGVPLAESVNQVMNASSGAVPAPPPSYTRYDTRPRPSRRFTPQASSPRPATPAPRPWTNVDGIEPMDLDETIPPLPPAGGNATSSFTPINAQGEEDWRVGVDRMIYPPAEDFGSDVDFGVGEMEILSERNVAAMGLELGGRDERGQRDERMEIGRMIHPPLEHPGLPPPAIDVEGFEPSMYHGRVFE